MERNDRLLRVLRREPVDRTPVWVMRQAGRYLPEYRETRRRAGDFMTLLTTPELACEVTLQPLARFPLDAAILFSDILTIPHAMGLGLSVREGVGPRLEHPVRTEADLRRLGVPDPERELRYVLNAVRLVVRELDGRVPLIGFAGSPWTLATYCVEGGASADFRCIKTLVYAQPALMHALLERLAAAVTEYLRAQAAAGAEALMIFDTWGGVLSTAAFEEFSLAYTHRVIEGLANEQLARRVPMILFVKGGGNWVEAIAQSGCAAVGLDWTQEIGVVRARVGHQVALQGNMDPAVLYATPERVRAEVATILASYGAGSGHVFNLGHGITPEVKPEQVRTLVEAVHELSRPYHLQDR